MTEMIAENWDYGGACKEFTCYACLHVDCHDYNGEANKKRIIKKHRTNKISKLKI